MDFKEDFNHKNSSNDFNLNDQATGNYDQPGSPGPERYEKYNQGKMKKKFNFKGILATITAGVVGSAITLAVLPYTGYIQNLNDANHSANTEAVATVSPVKTVDAKPTATGSTDSIADTVEKVSKAIVGIVNYQKQSTNFNDSFGGFGSFDPFGDSDSFSNGNGSGSSKNVEKGSGSGVIFQRDSRAAYIVTNNHVVEGASKLEISLYNGKKTTAKVVGTDALTDLAVLKIDAKYVTDTVKFGDSSTLRPGDQVYAIGNPLGLDLSRTVTSGIVSATNRSIAVSTSAGDWETNVIQTDAAINPGNSGGALINPQGQVVGINSLKISESGVEGLGFAIPSNDVIPIVNQLIKNGKIERPYLGVGLADLTDVPKMYWPDLPESVHNGVMITSVEAGSSADKNGIHQKDIIVSMNGTKISNSTDLRKYLYTKVKIGDKVKFGVYRSGKLINIQVTLEGKK